MAAAKKVRAKFVVTSVQEKQINQWLNDTKKVGEATAYDVTMQPVSGGSNENDKFFASTPGGAFTLVTVNDSAGRVFERGKEYYIDITPAEKA